MNDNICHCGAQAGYGHAVDCPFPLYDDDPGRVQEWTEAKERGERISKCRF